MPRLQASSDVDSPPYLAAPPEANPWLIAADLLDPKPNPYTGDPVGWVVDRLDEFLWSKQKEIAESVRDHRYTAVKSCHGAGKSYTAARVAAWWLDVHPPGEAVVVTTAPTFTQVRAILWKEISRAHRKGGLIGRVNQTEWWIGPEMVGMGRKPSDYDPAAFQGIHARYVLVILDEAGGVPKNLWDAVDTLVTNDDSRVLAIGNPDDPTAHFAAVHKPASGWNRIHISAFDTPNFTRERIPEGLRPLLVSETWVEERKKRWGEDSPLYIAKVLGEFPEAGTDNLIPLSWIERARDRFRALRDDANTKKLEQLRKRMARGPNELGVDVAWYGDDETVIAHRAGSVAALLETYRKQGTMETAGHVVKALRETGADVAKVEAVGVGVGAFDRLVELKKPVLGLQPGQQPLDTEQFLNARAEWYWGLRERFEENAIALDDDDETAAQLSNLKYKVTSRGQIQIESKEDIRKRGLPSPDRADAVMLAFATPPPEDQYVVEEDEEDDRPISPV